MVDVSNDPYETLARSIVNHIIKYDKEYNETFGYIFKEKGEHGVQLVKHILEDLLEPGFEQYGGTRKDRFLSNMEE